MKSKIKKKKNYLKTAIVASLMFISILSLSIAGYVYFSSKDSTVSPATAAKECTKLFNSGKYEELYNYLEGVSDISRTFSSESDQKKYLEFLNMYSNYLDFSQESDHLSRCTYYGEYEIYLKWSMYYASVAWNLAQNTLNDGTITGNKSPFKDITNKIEKQLKEKTGLSDSQVTAVLAISNDDSDYFANLASEYMKELKPKLSLKEFENGT